MSSHPATHRLFVYGTLRRGCGNQHAQLLESSGVYLGTGKIPGRLYRVDWYPGLRPGGGPGDWVKGDVFAELDEATLAELDHYEGSHEFRRVAVQAHLESGEAVGCWVYEYLGAVAECDRIFSGDWLNITR